MAKMNENPLMIRLTVNGSPQQVNELHLGALVASLGVNGRFAVERNGQLVPRGELADTALADGDRIEIVRAIGGG